MTRTPGVHPVQKCHERHYISSKELISSFSTYVIECAEMGMYGRATVLFHELVRLYDPFFPNVKLKVTSPLDGRMSVEYAVVVIYGVCFIHPCVHAVYTEVGAN